MINLIILLITLMGCQTLNGLDNKKPTNTYITKYKVGQCLYVIDPQTGRGSKKDALKVVDIDEKYYYYKWWVYRQAWGVDILKTIGEHTQFERLTKPLDKCPG